MSQPDFGAIMAQMQQKILDLEQQIPQRSTSSSTPASASFAAPKPNKPPSFAGKRNESIETWIKQVERYFRLTHIHPDDQVEWAAYYLTEGAASWFEVENHRAETIGVPLSWDTLAMGLRKRFKPINADDNARERLNRLKQTGSVATYSHAFRLLMQDLPDMHEKDALYAYKKGLKEAVAMQVSLRGPISVLEAEEMAETADSVLFAHRSSHEPSRTVTAKAPYRGPGGPTPMELDSGIRTALSNSDREQLRKEGKCFYCREGKHLAANCPSRKPRPKINVIVEKTEESGKEESP
jgi:retrotransposon gag protein